jgi:uncharacterized membrane protein
VTETLEGWMMIDSARDEREQRELWRNAHRPAMCGALVNIAPWERVASIVGGGGLLLAGLATRRPLLGIAAAIGGGACVYRGVSGNCAMYRALGINTAQHNPVTAVPAQEGCKVEESITVERTPSEVFQFWRDVRNLPRVMHHLVSVEPLDERRSRWTARGPWNKTVEWEAEIFNERENELIAWRSLPGSDVDTAGSVHFHSLPHDRGTSVSVSLKYNPPGGKVGASVAAMLGQGVEAQIHEDLRQFKCMLEAGEVCATSGQPVGGG